jgi:hypothetical protein
MLGCYFYDLISVKIDELFVNNPKHNPQATMSDLKSKELAYSVDANI